MCVCVGVVEVFRTDLHIDLGSDTIQDGVADFMHLFRQQAPAMLTDEIRSALDSSMDFDFREEYLLDLILHEAVTRVVQRLARAPPHTRTGEADHPDETVSDSDAQTMFPQLPEGTRDPAIQELEGFT